MYVYLKKYGNKIYINKYDKDGKKKLCTAKPKPEIYIPTKKDSSNYKVFPHNFPADKLEFNSIKDMEEFKENMGENIYGDLGSNHNELYYIRNSKCYKDLNPNLLKVFFIDIEVFSEKEFPQPNEALHPITSICIIDRRTKKSVIWGYCDYKKHSNNIEYRKFDCEDEMLLDFCNYIGQVNPDVMIGWNSHWFDFPYIYNRCELLIGKGTNGLSPFKIVRGKQKFNRERNISVNTMDIFGTQLMDYLEIYKKYTPVKKPSYSLNAVAEDELGTAKLDYSDEGNLSQLYINNPQKYIEYNYKDTEILYDLDQNKGMIDRVFGICHYARLPIEKFASPVQMWEAIMFNELMDRNMVFPPKIKHKLTKRITGAYVKDPQVGVYKWFASVDVNSEYPHTIISFNMSPETKIHNYPDKATMYEAIKMKVDNIVERKVNMDVFKNADICVAANGSIYRKDIVGIMPILMEKLYTQRKQHKKEMLKLAKKLEAGKISKDKIEETKLKIQNLDNLQWSEKIILNSGYGAFTNVHFRFFDREIGEGITLTAQTILKAAEKGLNEYLNKVLKTEKKNYVIYMDTDSCYIDCRQIVNVLQKKKPNSTKNDIVDFIDKFFQKKIEPELERIFEDLINYYGAYRNTIVMKREVIAESGFWTKKKKYAMKIWDDEGKRFKEPKLKIKGIEVVRSDTPKAVKKYLKELINKILDGEDIKKYIEYVKKEILKLGPEDTAITKSTNNIKKYSEVINEELSYKKGCPIHVRSAILHNRLVEQFKLDGKVQKINSGDKVKYVFLKMPNPLDENVIGFKNKIPKKFNLHKYFDSLTQYYKVFGKIAEDMCNTLGISIKNKLF